MIFAREPPLPSNTAAFTTFLNKVLPHISGPAFLVPWSQVDTCGAAPCAAEPDFNWAPVDSVLTAYIQNTVKPFDSGCFGGAACRIVLMVLPVNDSGNDNTDTPAYVFSPSYAATLDAAPQDVAICSILEGSAQGWDAGPPIVPSDAGQFPVDGYAVWNADAGVILSPGGGLTFAPNAFPTSNFSGYPVHYEAPFQNAYQHFLMNFLLHYSDAGSGAGPVIAPYLAYIRVGFHGGEDAPSCSAAGEIPGALWAPDASFPAGALVHPNSGNNGDYTFVANGAGMSGARQPSWCQTPGCFVASDGTIDGGWRNTGYSSGVGSSANAVWPGPLGQATEPHGFTDRIYLDYVNGVASFVASQSSAIPLDISSHEGPPFNGNWSYADSEAIGAVTVGVGFGNEGLSIYDVAVYEDGGIPHHDWVENFDLFASAPVVRHLTTIVPGAEQFPLTSISVAGNVATATCQGDCSIYCGEPVFVTGNTNPALDGTIWMPASGPCNTGTTRFLVVDSFDGGLGGTLWGDDYLPVTIPFAVAHHVTSLELHQCLLDYAYDASVAKCAGSAGPDMNYQNLICQAQH